MLEIRQQLENWFISFQQYTMKSLILAQDER